MPRKVAGVEDYRAVEIESGRIKEVPAGRSERDLAYVPPFPEL